MVNWSEIVRKLAKVANKVKDEALEISAEIADSAGQFAKYTKDKVEEANTAAGKLASRKCFAELTKNGETLKNYNTGELLNQPLEWISYPAPIFSEYKDYCAKEYLFQGYQAIELNTDLPPVDNHDEL
jgi:hypothetical protein